MENLNGRRRYDRLRHRWEDKQNKLKLWTQKVVLWAEFEEFKAGRSELFVSREINICLRNGR